MAPPKKPEKQPEPSFEQALARLEEVVEELESGETSLEKAIALVEEGEKLYQLCHQQLTRAEGKVEKLVARLGAGAETEPLDLPPAPGEAEGSSLSGDED
jgi:exodeoxyribonuclease VII small subunit